MIIEKKTIPIEHVDIFFQESLQPPVAQEFAARAGWERMKAVTTVTRCMIARWL